MVPVDPHFVVEVETKAVDDSREQLLNNGFCYRYRLRGLCRSCTLRPMKEAISALLDLDYLVPKSLSCARPRIRFLIDPTVFGKYL